MSRELSFNVVHPDALYPGQREGSGFSILYDVHYVHMCMTTRPLGELFPAMQCIAHTAFGTEKGRKAARFHGCAEAN